MCQHLLRGTVLRSCMFQTFENQKCVIIAQAFSPFITCLVIITLYIQLRAKQAEGRPEVDAAVRHTPSFKQSRKQKEMNRLGAA